ncbi:contactin-like [Phlebotomus papatasi]|uniref:contactin-like n=1 Tax=Phlebotomus papatasi TaxID=29031 RepID=UPI0024844108|nr:contactin-like [Phlebotomus papatasi]
MLFLVFVSLFVITSAAIEEVVQVADVERQSRGPRFVLQPRDIIFDKENRNGSTLVMFECLAEGHPTPTYSWFKEFFEGDRLTFYPVSDLNDLRFSADGGNLTIIEPQWGLDQGTYHCVAENKFGRILSNSAQLKFSFIRDFNVKRSQESAPMNWGKSLYCDPPQHYPIVKYHWSRDSLSNVVEENEKRFLSYDGTLYFSALNPTDQAKYSCAVQSTMSNTSRNGPFFPLLVLPNSNVQELTIVNMFPKMFPETPIAGQDIRLECMAFGYPIPSFNWTRRDAPLSKQAYLTNYNRVLIIPNATVEDSGEYVCTATNDRKSLSKSIHINLQMAPNFTMPLVDKICDSNTNVTFICKASAIPEPKYTWYKNAELIEKDQLPGDKFMIKDNILTIKSLDFAKDNGMYQCRADNLIKAVYSSGQLSVIPP